MHGGLRLKTFPAVETTTSTTTYTSNVYDNNRFTGLIVDILVSDAVETEEEDAAGTFSIQGKDPGSSTWTTLLTSAAFDENGGLVHLVVDPRAAAVANASARTPLPRQIRITGSFANFDAATSVVSLTFVP